MKRTPKPAPAKAATKPPPRPLERHELPAEVERYDAAVRKLVPGAEPKVGARSVV